jgi:hypothetical protein
MPTPPAVPLTTDERKRLRSLHLADQAAAHRLARRRARGRLGVIVAADALLVVFALFGAYAVGVADGGAAPAPWSTSGVSP